MPLFAMLAMGLGLMASPAESAPFAYVTNLGAMIGSAASVSVIDTATTPPSVVATIILFPNGASLPQGIAVAPDGKHAYVAQTFDNSVSVIDTASNTLGTRISVSQAEGVAITPDGTRAYVTNNNSPSGGVTVIDTASNTVVASIPVGTEGPFGIAITPDGKHAYVTNDFDVTVSVIDTATNTVVATIPVGVHTFCIAITPDGKHAYVTNEESNSVSVIDTASNTVVATIPVGTDAPFGIAITPNGKHAYVANNGSANVSVIDTASNTVMTTVPVGSAPTGVAVTPDGKHAYVATTGANTVSVIDTATDTVVATVTVGSGPVFVGIVPPPPGVPFLAFSAALTIDVGGPPPEDTFNLRSQFTLNSTAPGIHPVVEPVKLQVGTFTITIPPGSFTKQSNGSFTFAGVIGGVSLNALIRPAGTLRYAFHASATGANLTGTVNTVYVTLTVGGDSGATSAVATISP